MRRTSLKFDSSHDLLVEQLRDLYYAEQQLIQALPKMAKAATSGDLRSALEEHLEQTKEHAARLERIMSEMGAKRSGEACEAMKGLVKEGEQITKAEGDPDVRDAGIIGARAARGTLRNARIWDSTCACAKARRRRAASILQKTLNEEGEADHKLTSIAERHVNVAAAHG